MTVSSMIERITTPPMNSGSRSWVTSPWSTNDAVVPPTLTGRPALGRTSARRWRIRSAVCGDCGEVVGVAISTAVSPAGLTVGLPTAAIPGSSAAGSPARRARPCRRVPSARPPAAAGRWRPRRSPWTRGRRPGGWSSPRWSLPASGKPRRRPRNGVASTSSTAAAAMRGGPRAALDAAAPARGGRRVGVGGRVAVGARDPQPVDLGAREAEQRRQQRDRGGHRHEHGEAGRQRDALQVGEAHQEQPEQRDHDGRARRSARSARRW